MKKIIDIEVFLITSFFLAVALFISCKKSTKVDDGENVYPTAKPIFEKNCYTVCDVSKNPDLRLLTNVYQNQSQVDGVIDSTTEFWKRYEVRTEPIRLTQNYLVKGRDAVRYGWDSGVYINRIRLQCLTENIAPYDPACGNDWQFTITQGYLSPLGDDIFYDGLFQFDTYEKGNGNSWKFLYSDYKKAFNPESVPNMDYRNYEFCYSERFINAQCGDFYYNYFRLPNYDGIYKIIIRFNPLIKGCRAVKETNYNNNEETVYLEIQNGQVIVLNQYK